MKKWYQSKTVWINALVLIVGVLGYLMGHELIVDNADWVAILIAIQGAANVVLRFISYKPINV
jgi:hypothetical protein